jgi:SAM-dependent methyltransferase
MRNDEAARRWADTLTGYLPARRPLAVLDLGWGTGSLTRALARSLGGPVYGLEPSRRRRPAAGRDGAHPAVTYLAGQADHVPLPDACCDAALMFMRVHHASRPEAAFAELARVTRPSATLLIRCESADEMPDIADAGAAGFELVARHRQAVAPARPLRHLRAAAAGLLTVSPGPVHAAEATAALAVLAREADDDGGRLIPHPAADLLVLRRSDAA